MRRAGMKGVFLGILALLLPACGSPNSGPSEPVGVSPSPPPTPIPTDPGIETFPDEGHTHVPIGTVVVYHTDPPTSGDHYPVPQDGGFFDAPIDPRYLVHSMEHGGIIIYYNPATVTQDQQMHLKELAAQHPGSFSQVVVVPRNDPTYPVILTAWTHWLRLTAYDQSRIDGFVTLFVGQGPEHAPMNP